MTTLCHKNQFAHDMLVSEGVCSHEHVPADFDDGDPENGPGQFGSPAADIYLSESHQIVFDSTGLIIYMEAVDLAEIDTWAAFCQEMEDQYAHH